MMYTRKEVCSTLLALFRSIPDVIAVWEGGSAATGYLDAYSDLDLSIVCEEHAVESVFISLQDLLKNQYGILRSFRIPEPAWHGFSQCFYLIDQVPELFYLDIAIIKQSLPDKFTASDRHGKAVLWFENRPILKESLTPQTEIDAKCRRIYQNAIQLDFLMELEVRKALARNLFSEAFPAYYTFISRILVPMMNLKYRPIKADFGMRYIYREFPKAEADFVENLFRSRTIPELRDRFAMATEKYHRIKNELVSWETK